MNERLRELVERLHEKSFRGELPWRKGASGAFEVSFPRYTVAVDQSEDAVTEMMIYNDQGDVLDYVNENSFTRGVGLMTAPDHDFRTMLQDTYQMARRTALGSDQAIENLLAELKD